MLETSQFKMKEIVLAMAFHEMTIMVGTIACFTARYASGHTHQNITQSYGAVAQSKNKPSHIIENFQSIVVMFASTFPG